MLKSFKIHLQKIIISVSIKTKLIVCFVIVAILPYSILTYTTSRGIFDRMIEEYTTTNTNMLFVTANRIDDYYQSVMDSILVLYNDYKFMEDLSIGDLDDPITRTRLESKIKSFLYSREDIESVKFYNRLNHQLIYLAKNYGSYVKETSESELYKEMPYMQYTDMNTAKEYLSPLHDNQNKIYSGNELIFTLCKQFLNSYNYKHIADLTADFNTDKIEEMFDGFDMQNTEKIFIVNDNDELMFQHQSSFKEYLSRERQLRNLTFPETPGYITAAIDGEKYMIFSARLQKSGSMILRIIPLEYINRFIYDQVTQSILVNIILIIVSIFLLVLISNWITRPINKIILSMKEVRGGNFNVRIDDYSNHKELNLLTDKFNYMVEEINKLFKEKYELRLAQRTAQLKSLQSQINPHFLYNTLQSVQYMALERQAYEIDSMIVSLGDMLKYIFKSKDEMVTLEEEFQYAEKYLTIQRFRFIDNLEVKIFLDRRAASVKVPKMILQPLVENCFTHGYDSAMERFIIELYGNVAQDSVIIQVKDNGTGMNEDTIKYLHDKMDTELENMVMDVEHVGISNVYSRLKILYGESFTFNMTSIPYSETMIELSMLLTEES